MSTTQAADNRCGQEKAIYSRETLLNLSNNCCKIKRCTRKWIFALRIWNFCRKKSTAIRSCQSSLPSILCGNVQSARNKFDEITSLVMHHSASINIFTESWFNSEISLDSSSIVGYQTVRLDRDTGKAGGGIVGFFKCGLLFESISTDNPHHLEILPVYVFRLNLLVIAIYFPFWNNTSMYEFALDHLVNIVHKTKRLFEEFDYNILVVGDLNDLRKVMDDFSQIFKLKNLVNFNTRGNNSLDCVYSSHKNYSVEKLSPVGKSDHCLIKCSPLTQNSRKKKKTFFFKRIPDYSPRNRAFFDAEMCQVDFSIVSSIENSAELNFQLDILLQKIQSLQNKCFPLKKVKCNYNNLPWVNDSIRLCISKRDRAYSKKNKPLYKHYRLKVKTLIQQSKANYLSEVNKSTLNDNWDKIKVACNIKKKSQEIDGFNAVNLLDYFTAIQPDDDFLFDDINTASTGPVILTPTDIYSAVKKVKKGGGVPHVHPWLLKRYTDILIQPLLLIFQASLSLGIVPSSLKVAAITPVPKTKQPLAASDFRPITCVSPLLKVLEVIVYEKWLKHLVTEINFYDQFAFVPLKGRGCTTALMSIYGHILQHIDEGKYVNLLLVDLSKAFDRAATSRIFNNLLSLNAPVECLHWICNFLQNRRVCVKFKGVFSEFRTISGGVPQGSLISPLLFAILCHTLKPKLPNFRYIKYADDITIIHDTQSPAVNDDLQEEITHLINWCSRSLLSINAKKTQVMHIAGRKQRFEPRVTINNENIDCIDTVKLLGLTIQSNLKWNSQIALAISKATRLLFPILQLKRSNLDSSVLLRIYFSMVRSHLTYAIPVMTNMSQQLLNKILKTERRFYRILDTVEKPGILQSIEKLNSNLVQKVLSYEFHPIRQLLQVVPERRTRSKKSIIMPSCKSSLRRKSFIKFFL